MKKLALFLALILALSTFSVSGLAADSAYADTLFDQSKPIEINIIMSEEAWNTMIKNASTEEYNVCDLEVNGVLYENVAIRPKGNSSMSSVTSQGSQRYSWRIKFDKYEKKRTCDGLDVLILNNGFKDPGELREAIAYDMYAFLEADASLYNYALVSVNGEYFGCYLALEGVDKSFAKRNYGDEYGELYKPELSGGKFDEDFGADRDDNQDGGASFGGSAGGQAVSDENAAPEGTEQAQAADQGGASNGASAGGQAPAATEDGEQQTTETQDGGASAGGSAGGQTAPAEGEQDNDGASGGDGFGASAGGSAASDKDLANALNYVGDDLATYQNIWDNSKFKSEDEDHARVVEALKHVCQSDGFDEYLNLDNVLKYMAIQAFIYNSDGLTGTVSHN